MEHSALLGQTRALRSSGTGEWHSLTVNRGKESIKRIQEKISSTRILIADRDSINRDMLAHALELNGEFQAEGVLVTDLIPALSVRDIDLLVIAAGTESSAWNGFDLARTVHGRYPELGIVILLNESTEEHVINAFRSGARGVFSRYQPLAEFVECVQSVLRGHIWASKEETGILLNAIKSLPLLNLAAGADLPSLTARELEVIQHAAKGKTNRAIANDMGLSEHTIKNYLFKVFEKLGVSSRVELLFFVTQRGTSFGAAAPDNEEESL